MDSLRFRFVREFSDGIGLFHSLLEQVVANLNRLGIDRDRGTPRDATPPTPPGIRVRTNGGSIELGLGGRIDSGKTERLEIVVA